MSNLLAESPSLVAVHWVFVSFSWLNNIQIAQNARLDSVSRVFAVIQNSLIVHYQEKTRLQTQPGEGRRLDGFCISNYEIMYVA